MYSLEAEMKIVDRQKEVDEEIRSLTAYMLEFANKRVKLTSDANGISATCVYRRTARSLHMPCCNTIDSRYLATFGKRLSVFGKLNLEDIESWFCQNGDIYCWTKNGVMPILAGSILEIRTERVFFVGEEYEFETKLGFAAVPYLVPKLQLRERRLNLFREREKLRIEFDGLFKMS